MNARDKAAYLLDHAIAEAIASLGAVNGQQLASAIRSIRAALFSEDDGEDLPVPLTQDEAKIIEKEAADQAEADSQAGIPPVVDPVVDPILEAPAPVVDPVVDPILEAPAPVIQPVDPAEHIGDFDPNAPLAGAPTEERLA